MSDMINVAVCGAHMSGLALNHQLLELDAKLVKKCFTKEGYRLYVLENKDPIRPGMIYDSKSDSKIEVEVWEMEDKNFGKFMKQIASPLGIGTIFLDDGSSSYGFLCEYDYLIGAKEISELKSWREYLCQLQH